MAFFPANLGLRSSVVKIPFQRKSATFVVARLSSSDEVSNKSTNQGSNLPYVLLLRFFLFGRKVRKIDTLQAMADDSKEEGS